MIESAVCSWLSEDADTAQARRESPDSALYHDAHGDDLTKCDSWLCVCSRSDSRGGSWETTDERGNPREPTAGWNGYVTCTNCGRIYNRDGLAIKGPDNS
jgi:hypothetical protein